jgi:hypothetical protein
MLDYQLHRTGNRGRCRKDEKTKPEEPQQVLGPNGLM